MRRVSKLVVGIDNGALRQNVDNLNRQMVIDAAVFSASSANPSTFMLVYKCPSDLLASLYGLHSCLHSGWDGTFRIFHASGQPAALGASSLRYSQVPHSSAIKAPVDVFHFYICPRRLPCPSHASAAIGIFHSHRTF
jgi:hypothetical protein